MLDILDRLGRACYWICTSIATLLLVLGLLVGFGDTPAVSIFWLLPVLPIWGIGYLIKFVLCQPKPNPRQEAFEDTERSNFD